MKKQVMIISIILVMILTSILAGCSSNITKSAQSADSGKIKIITTIYPVYEFAKQVGGDKVEVTMLIPPGSEPHNWEPTAKDIASIKSAKLFLYHGAGLEPVDKILNKEVLGNAKAIEVSKDIPKLSGDKHEHEERNDSHHEHDIDVHTWLDPVYAQSEVQCIAAALAGVDEKNSDYYKTNAEAYINKLKELDSEYKQALAGISHKDIVTSHSAFGYLAQRYGLQPRGIMGLSPESEPTPDKLAEVVNFCREHNVKVIFTETMVSPKLAETLSKETGTELLVLNPIENLTEEEMKQGKNYISIMKENLNNLVTALK